MEVDCILHSLIVNVVGVDLVCALLHHLLHMRFSCPLAGCCFLCIQLCIVLY